MRYNKEEDRLLIDARELISTARRGIARSVPRDEEEPTYPAPTRRLRARVIGDAVSSVLTRDCGYEGHTFRITARADALSDGVATFCREAPGAARRLPKATVAEARGEAFLYGYLSLLEGDAHDITLRICYLDGEADTVTETTETVTREVLTAFYHKCMATILRYAAPEIERVTERMPTMAKVRFPYGKPRAGQDEMIRATYRTLARGGTLFASAPTGTGKTVSVLFPAVRALGDGRCDKVFYFTPKTTTADAAADCLSAMARNGVRLCAVILSAKERLCPRALVCRDGKAHCPLAKENHLPEATLALWERHETVIGAKALCEVADAYAVCPYELSLCYAELCDVIVCDVNYLFDPGVYIRRFFTEGGDYAFLIDEAHNLPDRAREMYSAELTEDRIREAGESELLGPLSAVKKAAPGFAEAMRALFLPYLKDELRRDKDGQVIGATHIRELPGGLYPLLDDHLALLDREITDTVRAGDGERDRRLRFLREYRRQIDRFREAAMRFDGGYECFLFSESEKLRVKLFCLDPAPAIAERLRLGRAAVFFSGTFTPLDFYRATLGGDGTSSLLEVGSPFDPSQLSVSVIDKITTRYSEREDSLLAVCRAIAATVSARRGNYMVFTPSFRYAEALSDAFRAKYPKLRVLTQTASMSAREKREFLAAFRDGDNHSYLIGFCVMGGVMAEGIDLAGDSLIGAVVVGIGMPGLSYEREAMVAYYDEKYEAGKQFAYIYPGMNRVMQAAGRVIRTERDRGVIVLIDDRFDDPIYREAAPALWQGMAFVPDAKALRERLDTFWRGVDEEAKQAALASSAEK